MYTLRTVMLSLVWLALWLAPVRAGEAPLKVLFIGNSYTYVNDLPATIAELAKAGKQRPLVHDRETPGGCTLEKHWKDGKVVKKIHADKWDWVVLQEHSLRPLTNRELMFDYGEKLQGEIRAEKAKTLLYMTWARQDKPETQRGLTQAYVDLAGKLAARVAPVGAAWEKALQDDPKLVLHTKDKSHPSKTGTYLAACVFYG